VTAVVAIIVVLALLVLAGCAFLTNTVRFARRNGTLSRRSPKLVGRGGPRVDEHNRTVR
jgi:hypothetical protein